MASTRALARFFIVFAAIASCLALAPVATSEAVSVTWVSPTAPDKTHFLVKAGKQLRLSLSATTAAPGETVHIAPARPLPDGAAFVASDGATAGAQMT